MSRRNARVGNNGQNGENLPESLANILMRQQRESSHFGKKRYIWRTFAKVLSKIQMRLQKSPLKVPILKKLANLKKKKNDQGSSSRVAILTKTKVVNGDDAPKFSQKLK